jgi:hypothetical protein
MERIQLVMDLSEFFRPSDLLTFKNKEKKLRDKSVIAQWYLNKFDMPFILNDKLKEYWDNFITAHKLMGFPKAEDHIEVFVETFLEIVCKDQDWIVIEVYDEKEIKYFPDCWYIIDTTKLQINQFNWQEHIKALNEIISKITPEDVMDIFNIDPKGLKENK